MKNFKNFGLIGLGLLFVANIALGFHIKGLEKHQPKKMTSLSDRFPHCEDFSGTWKGRCEYDNGEIDENESKIIRQQDCTELLVTDKDWAETISIGGINRIGSTLKQGGISNQDAILDINWNANRKNLLIRANSSFSSLENTWYNRVFSDGELSIDNGRLIETWKMEGEYTENGMQRKFKDGYTCTYEKQN